MALRAAQAVRATCDDASRIKIYLGVDHDDPKMAEYTAMCVNNYLPLMVSPMSGSVPRCVDWMWRKTNGDMMLIVTDDVIVRTKGWDSFIEAQFRKQQYLVISPNDGRKRRKLEQPIITRKWAETVGCFFPPFHHFCADEWIEKVAEQSGLIFYAMEIVFEHMHPKYGKGEWDDVYKRKRDEGGQQRQLEDKQRLADMAEEITLSAAKLVKASQHEAGYA